MAAEFFALLRRQGDQFGVACRQPRLVEAEIVLEAGAQVSSEFGRPAVDLELMAGDAGRRPGCAGQNFGQLAQQKIENFPAHRHGVDDAHDELHMNRRRQQPLVDQPARGIKHGEVEHLDFGLDAALQHLLGHAGDQLGMVLVDSVGEIDRAGGQGSHVGLQVKRLAAQGLIAPAAAGGELDDHARAMLGDAFLDHGEQRRVRRRGLVFVAHMDMGQGRPRLEGLMGRFDLLGGSHRHGGIISLAGHRAGDRDGDDGGCGHNGLRLGLARAILYQ